MLITFFNITSSVLDMVLQFMFFQITLPKRKKEISLPVFLLCFTIAEIFLSVFADFFWTEHTYIKMAATIFVNLTITFLLTLLYQTTLRHRIFVSVCCNVFFNIAELISGTFVFSFPFVSVSDQTLEYMICLLSKFIFLFMLSVTKTIWKRGQKPYDLAYTFSILFMPCLSIFLVFILPFPFTLSSTKTALTLIAYVGLFFANIINLLLLDNIFTIKELEIERDRLGQQNLFQAEKYRQLSDSYRSTRKILHETKRHFLYIQGCVQEENYSAILEYLENSLIHMEQNYSRINTGNLVIDSFVNNHMNMAHSEGIHYETDIRIQPSQVPVDDYDLCIILGNLLDNSIQECRRICPPHDKKILVEIYSSEYEFVIHVQNSKREVIPKEEHESLQYKMFHGYGLENVRTLTKKYSGSLNFESQPRFFDAIVVLPVFSDKQQKRF